MAPDEAGAWGMAADVNVFELESGARATESWMSWMMLGMTRRCIACMSASFLGLFRRRYGKCVVEQAKGIRCDNGRWMEYGFVRMLGKDLANKACGR